jgi:hypothetical protein
MSFSGFASKLLAIAGFGFSAPVFAEKVGGVSLCKL